ncbi:hypothetical protein [Streptomyces sp. NPDC058145]|uniref:hypothetical protein n=1 Tax=Streptomyces sp. NPDC058145 TaxID=3346356 RepID=UPI0036E543A3
MSSSSRHSRGVAVMYNRRRVGMRVLSWTTAQEGFRRTLVFHHVVKEEAFAAGLPGVVALFSGGTDIPQVRDSLKVAPHDGQASPYA